MRRIGVLTPIAESDSQSKSRIAAFLNELEKLGWTEGRDVRFDYRWASGNVADTRKHAAELVTLGPDVILAFGM